MDLLDELPVPANPAGAIERLRASLPKLGARDQETAHSLLDQASRRRLTPKQENLVEILIARAAQPKQEVALDKSFTGIVAFIDAAAQKLKFPKLLFRVDGHDYRLSIAGPHSSAPGMLNITDTRRGYEDRTWFGRITRQGVFEPSRKLTPETVTAIVAALEALAADPAGVARNYGHETGVCCFCGLDLTDPRSVEVGYGPVCASKWSLPWGSKPGGAWVFDDVAVFQRRK